VAKTPLESRRERLAAALRANLKRRKAGARTVGTAMADTPEPASTSGDKSCAGGGVLAESPKPR
jgi:hypothetical protein